MEYDFSIPGLEVPGTTVWDAASLVQLGSVDFHKLRNLLEDFGQRSAIAQALRAPITDIWKLRSSDQRLYLQTAAAPAGCCVVLGGLKVGRKKLFLHRANGSIVEVEPLCVLDFYVHESHQRQGVGKALFECMLDAEQQGAEQLGYDRPSSKLLAFLRKHYSLANYVPQPNNFVVYEQFFEHMPGSPGRSVKGSSSTSSSACWGPGALASLGHGQQTLHIIGSRAAAATGVDLSAPEPWVRSLQRPPTASLQHCVHLHTAQAGSSGGGSSVSTSSIVGGSLGGSSACSTNTSLGGAGAAPWSPLGGPGCPSAGTPTRKGEWDPHSPTAAAAAAAAVQHVTYEQQHVQQQQQQQQVQAPVFYGRGTGIKVLLQGSPPKDPYSHGGYQQALMAAAANPAPPRSKAGPLPPAGSIQQPTWQHQQQQQQRQYAALGGNSSSSGGGVGGYETCRDSLDKLVSGVGSSSSIYGTTYAGSGSTTAAAGSGGAGAACRQGYAVTAPFGSWEPRPGSLLPQDSADSERVSLKRQAAQLTQQRLQQQKPAWVVAGAGPPGHLLAAPLASYAVPTADMADVIGCGAGRTSRGGGCQELPQQRGGEGQWGLAGTGSGSMGRQVSRRPADSLCLSWDGLPQVLAAGGQQLGRNHSGSTQQGGDRLLYGDARWGQLNESQAAAQTHRSGSGAASCMRMV